MCSDPVPRGQVPSGLMFTVRGGLAPAAGGRCSQGFWELLNRNLFTFFLPHSLASVYLPKNIFSGYNRSTEGLV